VRTQLVTIPTDTLPLEGALHEPDDEICVLHEPRDAYA
jgi:hypothetical protein